jgi:hypothetical protein
MHELTQGQNSTRSDVIVSAALYLMSRPNAGSCPRLTHVIVNHLRILSARDDLGPVLCATCSQLLDQWECRLQTLVPPAGGAVCRADGRAAGLTSARIVDFKRRFH